MFVKKKLKGFTLIEIIIVIILVLIMISVASTLLVQQFQTFTKGTDMINSDWQARTAMERMTRDLRNSAQLITVETNNITFDDDQGYRANYYVSNKQLIYSSNEQGSSPTVLADNVKAITFTYYTTNGNATQIINRIKYLTISLAIESDNSNFNLQTTVFLWNKQN